MFVSRPEYEFLIPFAPGLPDSQHWRIVELSLHAPWFLLSVQIADAQDPTVLTTRTLCIAWDTDLADLLRSVDGRHVRGILCMVPGWQSANGQWCAREVSEVWVTRSSLGEHIVLSDTTGQKFDGGLCTHPPSDEDAQSELLIRVSSHLPRKRYGSRKRNLRSDPPVGGDKKAPSGAS
jgi:hypothetical protein